MCLRENEKYELPKGKVIMKNRDILLILGGDQSETSRGVATCTQVRTDARAYLKKSRKKKEKK